MLANMTISKKLYVGFSFMLLIIVVISFFGIIKVNSIDKSLETVVEVNSVKQRYAINFRGSVHDRAIAIRDLTLATSANDELFKNSLNDIRRLESFYVQSAKPMDEIFNKGKNVDAKEREILGKIKQVEATTLPIVNNIIELKTAGEHIEASRVLITQAKDNFTLWLKVVNEFIDYQEEKNQKLTPIAREIASNFKYTMSTILIISFIIGLLIAFFISNQISNSVIKVQYGLQEFFNFLNRKAKNSSIIDLHSKDEFGQMANSINQNIKNIEFSIAKDDEFVNDIARFAKEIGDGNMLAKIEKEAKTPSLNALREILIKMQYDLEHTISRSIPTLLGVLNSYKQHDFTARFPDPYAKVAVAINELGIVISQLLNQSYNVGKTLESSSANLIQNVNELNISSNEASNSLRQTVTAVEDITSSINSNAKDVSNMSSYIKQVDQSANEGQKLAKSTSEAMTEIAQQVTTINEAISVIDQIAFQTNILSLNAAVEAATAGEAGKGFAVVAQEVRNLASRSAEAAKEIKDIVELATSKASYGKEIGDKMIVGYDELLQNINKTLSTIQNIYEASKKQENGISQINSAVALLDRQSQRNAQIASQTQEIASKTDKIAKEIVNDLSNKKF